MPNELRSLLSCVFGLIVFCVASTNANAQKPPGSAPKTAQDRCLALAQNRAPEPRLLHRASLRAVALKPYQVRITYHGHSTFTIESPKGVTVATDYNDYVRPAATPTIATMNLAHDTHHSNSPDPGIKHVLHGWQSGGSGVAIHDLTVKDMRVRNVPTNIRFGITGTETRRFGNSVFIFEVGGLCIAHLGHLHHTLTTQQLAQIGQMDVVLVPVDGSYTLDIPGMLDVLKSLKAPLVIPMHYFSEFTLGRFLEAGKGTYEIVREDKSTIVVSRDQMPPKPRIMVLPPES